MASAKRTWAIYFDGKLDAPWVARPGKGAKVFFGAADSLVRFLIDGCLDVEAIRNAIRTVEAGGEVMVLLEDRTELD